MVTSPSPVAVTTPASFTVAMAGLLDEAFSKMTSDRIRPMMELFRRLQLQVLLISTVEKSTAIQPYCDITYSIVRHGDANAIAPFYRLTPPVPDAPETEEETEDE